MNGGFTHNELLLMACTAPRLEPERIEALLSAGAKPMGRVREEHGEENNLYTFVVEHFMEASVCRCRAEDGREHLVYDRELVTVTEIFLRWGMDLEGPEMAYDGRRILHPLWLMALPYGETFLETLKRFLDSGVGAGTAGMCWHHGLDTWLYGGRTLEGEQDRRDLEDMLLKLLLTASYPALLREDPELREAVWLRANSGDPTRLRNWRELELRLDLRRCESPGQVSGAVAEVLDRSGRTIWRLGLGISPEEA